MKNIFLLVLLFTCFLFAAETLPPTSHGRHVSGNKTPGSLISFSGSLSVDNDAFNGGYTPMWQWDFIYNGVFSPDASTTSASVNYTYPNAGSYTVAVIYRDNDNQYGNMFVFTIDIVGTTKYYYVKDHLGTVRITMNQQGNVVSAQDYYAYGEILRSINNADPHDKVKFTDKERDTETGLDYFGARYYDPDLGRWLQADPLSDDYPSWSPYVYSFNNPLNFIDPLGKEAVPATAASMPLFEYFRNSFWQDESWKRFFDKPAKSDRSYSDGLPHIKLIHSSPFDGLANFTEWALSGTEDLTGWEIPWLAKEVIKAGSVPGMGIVKFAKGGSHLVYEGLDAAGKVRYVGITGRDAAVRFGEHLNSLGTGKELLRYQVIKGAEGLSKSQARIWEQTLIKQYGLQKNGGMLLNKVNSIAPKYWFQYGINP